MEEKKQPGTFSCRGGGIKTLTDPDGIFKENIKEILVFCAHTVFANDVFSNFYFLFFGDFMAILTPIFKFSFFQKNMFFSKFQRFCDVSYSYFQKYFFKVLHLDVDC